MAGVLLLGGCGWCTWRAQGYWAVACMLWALGLEEGRGGGAEGKLCHAIITTARTAILARYYYCSSTRHAVISKARCELCGRQAKPRVIHHHHWS